MKHPILIVPGWQDSGAGHWQTLWEKKLGATRVNQEDWMYPKRSDWVSRLESFVRKQGSPPILIAHSLGCITAAILSAESNCKIAGAFLVAPVDLEMKSTPVELAGFLPTSPPTPIQKLRFRSIVVASSNDPYCSLERAQKFAETWGSEFVNIGPSGHINVASGFGEWNSGLKLLHDFNK